MRAKLTTPTKANSAAFNASWFPTSYKNMKAKNLSRSAGVSAALTQAKSALSRANASIVKAKTPTLRSTTNRSALKMIKLSKVPTLKALVFKKKK